MAIQSNFPAIKPSLLLDFANTKQLDPRITYTRASTATFYNGVTTAKAEENLMLRSQEFDTGSWSKAGGSITANSVAAPDATTTADTFTEDTSTSSHNVNQTFSGTTALPYTWSAYVKANGRTKVVFFCQATGVIYSVRFDLTGVTTTNVSGTGTATITDVGNGWYRITATATSTATGTAYWQLNLADGSNNTTYTGDGTSGVYLWGAQLEQRSAVSAYTTTTTQAITNYIPALQTAASGVARFDNNPTTGESLGLLIEESRTNLLTYSAAIDNAAWTKASAAITADTAISPDGTLTADKFVCSSGSALLAGAAYQALSKAASAITYTYTFYAKAGGYNRTQIYVRDSSTSANGASAVISLVDGSIVSAASATGTFTSASAATINVGNGWYRISITFTSGTETAIRAYVQNTDSVATTTDGFSGIYVWGAQLEAGAFATSYIPTVASQVTRAADAASMTGTNFSSWFNVGAITTYADFISNGFTANQIIFSYTLSASSIVNPIQLYFSAATTLNFDCWGNGTGTKTAAQNTAYKIALGLDVNNLSVTLNADAITSDTSVGPAQPYTQLNIGNRNGSLIFNGTIKKIAYYPLRLTNAQLQALTS